MKLSPVTAGGPTDKPPPDAPAGFDTMMSHANPAE
jgi:hypothetical protein